MATITPTQSTDQATRLLSLQGWTGADLAQARETGIWQRLSPALCMALTVLGTVLASPAVLSALAVTAVAGTVAPGHPFDVLYNRGLRHLLGRPALPASRAARRSACAVAALWLVATAGAFAAGDAVIGYALGASLAAAGAVFTFSGFCIPSFMFNGLFGPERACATSLPAAARRRR